MSRGAPAVSCRQSRAGGAACDWHVARQVLGFGGPLVDTGEMATVDLDAALAAARQGDEDGMSALYRALNPALLRYLRHRVPRAAEDIASEVWLAAARNLASTTGDAADFRSWLFAVARNKTADHFRAVGRRPETVPLSDDGDHLAEPDDPAVAAAARVDSDLAVRALVADLPADQAEVVLLRVVAGLGVDEVAAIMGRSAGSVRVLQHRALRRLARSSRAQALRPGASS